MTKQWQKDMEAGTQGPWFAMNFEGPRNQHVGRAKVYATNDDLVYVCDCNDVMCFHELTNNEINARRIARVPKLEALALAVLDMLGALPSGDLIEGSDALMRMEKAMETLNND